MFYFDLFFSVILGSIFGSFSTFIGYRLFNENKDETLISRHSICCNCKHKLSVFDLIPIFSFIFLKGKCRYCKTNIPIWHFLAEICMILSFLSATIYFKELNYKTTILWLICFCLITQSIIDYRTMMSSDVIHVITFISTIILAKFIGYSQKHILIMIFVTLTIFLALAFLMKKILHKDCIGFGDIKLFVILSPILTLEKLSIFFGFCGLFGIIFYIITYKIFKNRQMDFKKKNNIANSLKVFPFIPSIYFSFLFAFYF